MGDMELCVEIIEDGDQLREIAARIALGETATKVYVLFDVAIVGVFEDDEVVGGFLEIFEKSGDERMIGVLETGDFALERGTGFARV
jgi:hypothetical protein